MAKSIKILDGTPIERVRQVITATRGGWESQPDHAFATLWNRLAPEDRATAIAEAESILNPPAPSNPPA